LHAPVRVGIYARISSDREGDELGVKRQRADCEKLAAARGWLVVGHYVDDDISAWSGRTRPEYERMLDDLRSGHIRGVVVWHLDRLTRHPRELEAFIDLCDAVGVEMLACVTGDVHLETHNGRMMARMLGIMARYESDHKSERILRKHEELALAGKVSGGGSRPYGYEADRRTVCPAEAAIVKECVKRFLAGESLRSISIDLNTRGVTAAAGGEWSPQSLRRMLASARISGQREHRGEVVAKAEWPAIITLAQHRQIRTLLADPNRRTSKEPRRYLLGGLLVCSHCGEKLVARPRAGGQRRYHCAKGPGLSGCGKTAIKADDVEDHVVRAVLHRLDDPKVAAAQAKRPKEPDARRWHDQLEADRQQFEELAAAYGRKEITMAEWRAARAPIEQRMTAARKQLAKTSRADTLEPFLGKGEELRAQWKALDLSQQHAIVAKVLDHVVVGPGRPGYNRFDPSRLRAVWIP
jgi:site-specific DNA recombinase